MTGSTNQFVHAFWAHKHIVKNSPQKLQQFTPHFKILDPRLRSTSVHQKDQRKQQAIKMTVSIIAAFYICIFPSGLQLVLQESQTAISCTTSKVLRFISDIMLCSSSSLNPTICITFVQSFRQGFKEITLRWRKCFTSRSIVETSQSEEITLRDMRIIPGIR